MTERWKRAIDIAGASVGLLALAPLFALVAFLIRIDSRGPILYRQRRVGRHFRPFWIVKFRTMTGDAAGGPLTIGCDPRVTRVGRILRRTKIDELPQLYNVLRGEMSLVGPRPEVDRYVSLFEDDYRELLQVRPGMTDLASLKYRDEASLLARSDAPELEYVTRILPDKLSLGRAYVRELSIGLDLRLIARTLRAMIQ